MNHLIQNLISVEPHREVILSWNLVGTWLFCLYEHTKKISFIEPFWMALLESGFGEDGSWELKSRVPLSDSVIDVRDWWLRVPTLNILMQIPDTESRLWRSKIRADTISENRFIFMFTSTIFLHRPQSTKQCTARATPALPDSWFPPFTNIERSQQRFHYLVAFLWS